MALLPHVVSNGPYSALDNLGPGGAAYPSAHLIVYCPIRVPSADTVRRVFWDNDNVVSGNVNVGLYSATGTRLWALGSTAQSGTSAIQFADIADQALAAGLYYMAFQCDNTSAKFGRMNPAAYIAQSRGVLEEQAASFALPATATFAKATNSYIPVFGLDLRGAL